MNGMVRVLLLTSTLWVGGCGKEKQSETCRRVKACCTALEPMDKALELGELVGDAFSKACSHDSTQVGECATNAAQIGRAFAEASIPLNAEKRKPPRRPPACEDMVAND